MLKNRKDNETTKHIFDVINKDVYKPVLSQYSYELSVSSLCNDLKCYQAHSIIDNSTNILQLDPISMSYSTFRSFFYPNGSNAFNINPAKKNCFQVSFDQQTFSDGDGTHKFDLLDHILCIYENSSKISRNLIPAKEMIKLTKEINEYKSLFDVCGCVSSLKWTDIIDILKANGLLSIFDEKICLKITFNYVNEKLFNNPVIIEFQYLVSNIYENIILQQKSSFAYKLDNSMFSNGTYRITRPGTYTLTENIIFNPNRYDNNTPRPDQDKTYPRENGYVLGFFAVITVEATNVIIDLNGFSIELHDHFNLRQRFCALIELASSPFIPKQGPANFGSFIVSAKNVVIKNGILGQVSHHGIHGNGCKNVLIENIDFKNFEVAAISINGGENITVNNCNILHINRNINVLSTYSHVRFGLPKLIAINKESKEELFLKTHYGDISLRKIQTDLENAISKFEKFVDMGFPVSDSIFYNESGLYDGNVYGIVFNSIGHVIGDFKPMRDDKTIGNKNITIKNTSIENIISDATEVASLYDISGNQQNNGYGGSTFVGPAGDVFNFLDNIDDNGYYNGTIIGNLQMAICLHGTDKLRGTGNIPISLCKEWIFKKQNIMDYISIESNDYSKDYSINRDKDSMSHSMKGNIGLFISQGDNVIIDNVYIYNVCNKSIKKERTKSTDACGIVIVGSKNIYLSDDIRIKHIKNPFGDGEPIKYINM